jgi:prepilin-type N-terminal cleavage/methylation domain-containing protein
MKKGFSLTELLVIIAIIGIMISVSLVSLVESKNRKDVEMAAREVAAVAREAQNYALTGKGAKQGNSVCDGYRFTWFLGTPTYRFSGIGGAQCTQPYTANYTLKSNTSFSTGGYFDISLPHAELTLSVNPTPIKVNKGNHTFSVCVYQSGRVEEVRGSSCP